MRSRLPSCLLLVFAAPLAAADVTHLSLSCAVCHGSAQSPSEVPRFYGQTAETIARSLRAYRDGSREGSAMPRLARAMSDAEIEALAQHFGGPAAP